MFKPLFNMKTKVLCPKCNMENWTEKSFGEFFKCRFCNKELIIKEKVTIEVI